MQATSSLSQRHLFCPNCGHPLARIPDTEEDLFCWNCHTAVALMDNQRCAYLLPGGDRALRSCHLDTLGRPPMGRPA